MVNFKLINWARMNGIDLSRHTDCIDNVRGVCNPRKINCIDVRNCPCKKQRRELAQAAYDRHLSELEKETKQMLSGMEDDSKHMGKDKFRVKV